MKFKLETADCYYNKEGMEKLKALGFKFEALDKAAFKDEKYYKIDEDEEEYEGDPPSIEINSLEELMDFMGKFNERIIIDKEENKIIIYDTYIEG